MEKTKKIIFLALLGFSLSQSFVLPKEKCKDKDNACLIKFMQNLLPNFASGIPEYGIEEMDPFKTEDIALDVSGFQYGLTGGVMTGLKDIIVDKFDLDLKNKTMNLKLHTDASLKAHYTADGTIFGQLIKGDGDMEVTLKNFELLLLINFDIQNIDGKDYIKIKQYQFDFDVKDNAHYHMTNMFNGDKELSDAALNFANTNWHDFALAFGRPLLDIVTKKVVENMNKLYKNVALDEFIN